MFLSHEIPLASVHAFITPRVFVHKVHDGTALDDEAMKLDAEEFVAAELDDESVPASLSLLTYLKKQLVAKIKIMVINSAFFIGSFNVVVKNGRIFILYNLIEKKANLIICKKAGTEV